MNWLVLVVMAAFLDATRIFIDNYASDVFFKGKDAVAQKLFYGYVWIAMGAVMLFATGFDAAVTTPGVILQIVFSGFLSSFAGIPYYRALEIDDSTNLGIFIQTAPILYLVLGWFLLNDAFSPVQLVAFCIILAAPLLIVMGTRKRSRKIKLRAVFYAFMYVLISVVANLIFVKVHTDSLNFASEVALVFIGSGVASLVMIYGCPRWRRRFYTVLHKSKGKLLTTLSINSAVSGLKTMCYRAALVAAPAVALASVSSDAVEPIIIFFMGIVLTLIWPKFGREKLDRKTVTIHLVATVLVVVGIVLLRV